MVVLGLDPSAQGAPPSALQPYQNVSGGGVVAPPPWPTPTPPGSESTTSTWGWIPEMASLVLPGAGAIAAQRQAGMASGPQQLASGGVGGQVIAPAGGAQHWLASTPTQTRQTPVTPQSASGVGAGEPGSNPRASGRVQLNLESLSIPKYILSLGRSLTLTDRAGHRQTR